MSKHLKIALVDDDIPNTEILRDFLIRNGYSHVDKYHDGESFLESIDRFDERAVVLDFDLSGGSSTDSRCWSPQGAQPPNPRDLLQRTGQPRGGRGIPEEWSRRLHREVQRGLRPRQDLLDKVYDSRSCAERKAQSAHQLGPGPRLALTWSRGVSSQTDCRGPGDSHRKAHFSLRSFDFRKRDPP